MKGEPVFYISKSKMNYIFLKNILECYNTNMLTQTIYTIEEIKHLNFVLWYFGFVQMCIYIVIKPVVCNVVDYLKKQRKSR